MARDSPNLPSSPGRLHMTTSLVGCFAATVRDLLGVQRAHPVSCPPRQFAEIRVFFQSLDSVGHFTQGGTPR